MDKVCSNKDCPVPILDQIFGTRKSGRRLGKPRSECKVCEKARAARVYKDNPDKSSSLRKKYTKKQALLHGKDYYASFDLSQSKKCTSSDCTNKQKTYNDFYRNKGTTDGFASVCKECKWNYDLKLKQVLVSGYGGRCTCCGEDEIRFLTLEHLERDGKKHREDNNNYIAKVYRQVIKEGFPCKYTILCYNCNCCQNMGRKCPHKERVNE